MSGPGWLADALAALTGATAMYCVARLIVGFNRRRTVHRDVDLSHVIMGVAMTAMLIGAAAPGGDERWGWLFVGLVAWFAARAVKTYIESGARAPALGHFARHATLCAAMIVMLGGVSIGTASAAPPSMSMADMPASGPSAGHLAMVTVAIAGLVCIGAWSVFRLALPVPRTEAVLLAPRAAICCELAMAMTMTYMFVVM